MILTTRVATADEMETAIVARIAACLTPRTVERLLGEEDGDVNALAALQFVDFGLIVADDDGPGWKWSALGLQVRDLLRRGEGA